MLNWIRIKNLALVEEADIEFDPGFNVITGETGAGKSVIIGTVSLLLGERADKNLIRTGADRSEICAEISVKPELTEKVDEILREAGIEFDPKDPILQIRRLITPSTTRNFINDTPTTLQTLKKTGDLLIDVHAANEHQSLIKQSVQLDLIDSYGKLDKELAECEKICLKLKDLRTRQEKFDSDIPSAVEAGHLRMIIDEINRVNPQPDEDKELSAKHALAANSRQIIETANQSINQLNEAEGSVTDMLAGIYRNLLSLEKIDPDGCSGLVTKCDQTVEMVRDIAFELENYTSNIELDEQEFMELEERLSAIQTLKRRYGPGLEDVFTALQSAQDRLEQFENSEELRQKLAAEEQELTAQLDKASSKLSEKRKTVSGKFASEVVKELKTLGFLKSEFWVDFSRVEAGTKGFDRVDFIFSANPGEKAGPLRNIASSGEISRVMLALKTILAAADSVPILVFDEIDVNIGGETAVKVGEELRKLAATHQILCISHLPQVAAQAEKHLLVEKTVSKGRTSTMIKELCPKGRTSEIGRMLGGSKAAMEHAADLIANSTASQ